TGRIQLLCRLAQADETYGIPTTFKGHGVVMDNAWREVARLTFKVKRFEDHALDVDAMPEIVQCRRIVLETAKVVWRKEHPDRERLPKQYEDGIRFFVSGFTAGSAIVPLDIIEPQRENTLFQDLEELSDLEKAMRITH